MLKRMLIVTSLVVGALLLPSVAYACGGLVAPNGAVNLVRTTTLAAYHQGIEHYITAFEFSGLGGAKFGSIVPLPGEPTSVKRAGDWTLQRLLREVQPPAPALEFAAGTAADSGASVRVVLRTKVDSLDITVVEGGAAGVARWATEQGFQLSPDAPEVLEFYAQRSRYFMAVSFDAERAQRRGQSAGDSVPVHIRIPTKKPWVPLRILALGRQASEVVQADIFLLTDQAPALLPAPVGAGDAAGLPVARGLSVQRSERASDLLMSDLRSDKGMGWMPKRGMWLTYLQLGERADRLGYDLAIDPSGKRPSWRAAGFPKGIFGPERNPIGGPSVQIVRQDVPFPVAGPVQVDRTGWMVTSILLALATGVAVLRRTLWRRASIVP